MEVKKAKAIYKALSNHISPKRLQRFEEVLKNRTDYICVAVEDVFQMHNTSAVIRSCDVFGFQSAHLIEGNVGIRLDKNIAMGAQQWVDTTRYESSTDCINQLRAKGYQIVATTPHKPAVSLNDFVIHQKTAVFFGTEKKGLSEEVLTKADLHLRIDMMGFSESLNISVAAAIALQHLSQELRTTKIDWKLPENRQWQLRAEWIKKSIKDADKILERYGI
ncbi:MAG: RNA methyltransferase [Flavobacteriaceae bacterium]|nr:RNA methyltransferase [Flavobacteriaceae bacterium]